MKAVIGLVGILLILFGLTWIIQGNDFFIYKVFAPAEEQVRYNVFNNSLAYDYSVALDLQQLQKEYLGATPEQKKVLITLIVYRIGAYDVTKLPPNLQTFINEIKSKGNLK